jgi:hypothetical protein
MSKSSMRSGTDFERLQAAVIAAWSHPGALMRTGSKREIAAAISANLPHIISLLAPPQWRGSSTGHESQTASWGDHSGGIANPASAAVMDGRWAMHGDQFQL